MAFGLCRFFVLQVVEQGRWEYYNKVIGNVDPLFPTPAGLGEIYVSDERFKRNIDSFGKGTAEFIYEAIKNYCAD